MSSYSAFGDIILLGDFNAQSGVGQVPIHDAIENELHLFELDLEDYGLDLC